MALKKNPGQTLTNAFKGLRDVIPPKVLAKLGFTITKQANPNDVVPTALSAAVLESSCQTDRTDERSKEVLTVGGTSATFVGQQITDDLQVATVTENWGAAPTITATATTVSGSVEDDGTSKMARIVEAPSVLPLYSYTAEKVRWPLPELFYVGVASTTVEATTTGAAAAPSLTGSQIRITDAQRDAFNKRTTTTTLGTITDGTTYTGKEHVTDFGGAVVDNVQSKEAAGTLTVDFRTVRAKSVPLGDGKFFVEYQKLPSGSWPTLTKTEWDDFAQRMLVTTTQVVAVGTVTSSNAAGILTTENQLDDLHTLKVIEQYSIISASNIPIDQVIPVSVEVSVPDWFTSGPTQVDATSGIVARRGTSYETESKNGKFPGTLTRSFSAAIPSAPAGTYLNFNILQVQTAEDYASSGDDQYAEILYYNEPNHIVAEPTGAAYIVGVQVQQHHHLWVLEVLTVDLS